MSQTNYVFITSTNAWGGIERWLLKLTNKLCEKQHNVHLLLIRNGSIPYPDEINKKIKITRIENNLWNIFLRTRILNFLKTIENPVVISFKIRDWYVISKIKQSLPSLNTFFVVHSTLSKGLRGNRRIISRVSKALNSPNKIICVSKGVAEHICSSYNICPKKVEVIYNPIIDFQSTEQMSTECDHPWLNGVRPDIPTFISAGRLVVAKDFSTLIRAFGRVNKTQESRLIILGEGPLRLQLEKLVIEEGLKNKISLPGFVTNPEAYFKRASTFVLSSVNEGLGNVLIEALHAGIPVVSTDCPNGPREILEDGQLGALVSPGDIGGLAEAMLASLRNQQQPNEYLTNSLMRFDVNHIADRYINITQS